MVLSFIILFIVFCLVFTFSYRPINKKQMTDISSTEPQPKSKCELDYGIMASYVSCDPNHKRCEDCPFYIKE